MLNLSQEELPQASEESTLDVVSLNQLGLHDLALTQVTKDLETSEDSVTLYNAVLTAIVNRRYSLAADYAKRLEKREYLDKADFHVISLAYNYAGLHEASYKACKRALEFETDRYTCSDLYTLACRAGSIGKYDEALKSILQQFSLIDEASSDFRRKVFLDSELAEVWLQGTTSTPYVDQVLDFYFADWRSIAFENQSIKPERSVDHGDLAHIPEEFHCLLKPQCAVTFLSAPVKEAQFPELHRRYLEWQAETVAPRVQAFIAYMEKCEEILIARQPLFAAFQADRGRIGLSRSHLLCILRHSKDCDPALLPDLPMLRPLLSEFRAQYQESPEAFRLLVHAGRQPHDEEFFTSLPPVNRASILAALYLGNCHFRERRYADAIRSYVACHKLWPQDDTTLLNAVYALQKLERFEDAAKVLALVSKDSLPLSKRSEIERNIANKDSRRNPCCQNPKIPTPEFGGYLPGGNEEFHQWTAYWISRIQENSED